VSSPWTSNIFRNRQSQIRATRARGGLARVLIFVLLALTLLPLIIFAFLVYNQAQGDINSQVTNQLKTLAALKAKQIDQWAIAHTNDLDNLTSEPDLLRLTQSFVLSDTTQVGRQEAREILLSRLRQYVRKNQDYDSMLVANADGKVLLTTNDRYAHLLDQSLIDRQFFRSARQTPLVTLPRYDAVIEANNVLILAVAPVRDPQLGPIAVIIGTISADKLLDIVSITEGLGSSGTAYLVTGEGYQIGVPITADTVKPTSLGIQRAIGPEHANGTDAYVDPRGNSVLGSYFWVPRFEVALLIEQSTVEAYGPIRGFTLVLGGIVGGAILFSVVVTLLFTRWLTRPIQDLTDSAERMAAGDLSVTVNVQRNDELGLLSNSFNSMVTELRGLYSGLENKVDERTRQLAAAAEVGRAITSVLNLQELLTRVVDLIRDRFRYYFVAILLIDETGQYAIFREGTGDAGQRFKAQAYSLPVGSNSIVGWVTANKKTRVASDVGDDPFYFKSDLLPHTRSEAAIPLLVGERIIGVLDVQSRETDSFGQGDIESLQIVADQIAVAIENGRLFARQERVAQLEQVVSKFTNQIHRSLTLDTILETAARELGAALNANRVVVHLKSATEVNAQATPEAAPSGPNGHGNGHTGL